VNTPGNIEDFAAKILASRTTTYNNQDMILLVGGTANDWANYLCGPRAQAIVRAVNKILEPYDLQLYSAGIKSNQWIPISCAEALYRSAMDSLRKAPNAMKNAYQQIQAVYRHPNASPQLRDDSHAWLELFATHGYEKNWHLFIGWADEMYQALPALRVIK
jgi:hypothetical protein